MSSVVSYIYRERGDNIIINSTVRSARRVLVGRVEYLRAVLDGPDILLCCGANIAPPRQTPECAN